MPQATLQIDGMTCSHCAAAVERALKGCKGVTGARVDLAGKRAEVSGEAFATVELRQAVESLGYKVLNP